MNEPEAPQLPPPRIELGAVEGHRAIALRITLSLTPEAGLAIAEQLKMVAQQKKIGLIVPDIHVDMNGEGEPS